MQMKIMKIKLPKNLNSVQFIIVQVLYSLILFKFHEAVNARLQKKLLKARNVDSFMHTKEFFFNQVKAKYFI